MCGVWVIVAQSGDVAICGHGFDSTAQVFVAVGGLCKVFGLAPGLHVALGSAVDVASGGHGGAVLQWVGVLVVAAVVARERDRLAYGRNVEQAAGETFGNAQVLAQVHAKTLAAGRLGIVVHLFGTALADGARLGVGDGFGKPQQALSRTRRLMIISPS